MGFQQLADALALGKRENVQFRADDAARYSQNFPQGWTAILTPLDGWKSLNLQMTWK